MTIISNLRKHEDFMALKKLFKMFLKKSSL